MQELISFLNTLFLDEGWYQLHEWWMIINVEQLSKTANGLIFETQPVQIGLGLIATGK